MRYVNKKPIIPVGYTQHRNPMWKKSTVNKYTPEGRAEIHKALGVNMSVLHALMNTAEISRSIEYTDNRISLYAAQNGKCAVTGNPLALGEIHCHHKRPKTSGGTDKYENLIIVHSMVHVLIHVTRSDTVAKYLTALSLTQSQLKKLNKLRKEAELFEIT